MAKKKNKMDITWNIVDDYMKKFEKMMNSIKRHKKSRRWL